MVTELEQGKQRCGAELVFQEVSPGNLLYLNQFTFFPAELVEYQDCLENAPPKIKKRLLLTQYHWCRMGTVITPPGTHPHTTDELSSFLDPLNTINQEAGRPRDKDLFIRTAAIQHSRNAPSWTEPAFLVANVGTTDQVIKNLTTREKVTFDQMLTQTAESWWMIHTDNYDLQKAAIHGRLHVDGNGARLDLGTNVLHAREIEDGVKTKVSIPFTSKVSFFDMDSPVYRDLTIHGKDLSQTYIRSVLQKFSGAAPYLESFMEWMKDTLGYVAEFRYYTKLCKFDERLQVMDMDASF